jgi:c-di-GMP-binding flagellar brake protein YcgR
MDTNRRAFYRVSLRMLEARLTGICAGRASRFVVRIIDLSGGGSLVWSPRELKPGDAVRLHLPPADLFRGQDLPGRVVRIEQVGKHWQIALQFTSLSDAARDQVVRRVNFEELRSVAGAPRLLRSTGS